MKRWHGALTVAALVALEALVTPANAAPPTDHTTVSLDAITAYFANENARMTAGSSAQAGTASPASAAESSIAADGTDVTGLLLASFRESGDTVLASRTTVTGARASGADVLAEVRYDWTLQDGDGNTFESSASDTHRLLVDQAGQVRSQRFEPVPATPATGPRVPKGALPASAERPAAGPSTRETSTDTGPINPAAVSAAAAPPMGYLNPTAMRNYALTWTDSAHADKMNPAYPKFDNNCANFVSQTLHEGGWKYRDGYVPSTLTNWSPNLSGPAGSSYTWGGAAHLHTFGLQTAKLAQVANIWNTFTGDLLFTDWDPNGRADGKIDHALVITGRDTNGPLVTQKSSNRHNVPMATYLAIAKSQGKTKIIWYGLVT